MSCEGGGPSSWFGVESPADMVSPHLECANGGQTPEVQAGRAGRRLHAMPFDDGVPCWKPFANMVEDWTLLCHIHGARPLDVLINPALTLR